MSDDEDRPSEIVMRRDMLEFLIALQLAKRDEEYAQKMPRGLTWQPDATKPPSRQVRRQMQRKLGDNP